MIYKNNRADFISATDCGRQAPEFLPYIFQCLNNYACYEIYVVSIQNSSQGNLSGLYFKTYLLLFSCLAQNEFSFSISASVFLPAQFSFLLRLAAAQQVALLPRSDSIKIALSFFNMCARKCVFRSRPLLCKGRRGGKRQYNNSPLYKTLLGNFNLKTFRRRLKITANNKSPRKMSHSWAGKLCHFSLEWLERFRRFHADLEK
jgi:hypothetical protein